MTLVTDGHKSLAVRRYECHHVWQTLESRKEVVPLATSKKDASKAGKLLSNPKTPASVKSVAGSDLAQAKGSKKK